METFNQAFTKFMDSSPHHVQQLEGFDGAEPGDQIWTAWVDHGLMILVVDAAGEIRLDLMDEDFTLVATW